MEIPKTDIEAKSDSEKRKLDDTPENLTPEQEMQLKSQMLCYRILLNNGNIPQPVLQSATKKSDLAVEAVKLQTDPSQEKSHLKNEKRVKREKDKVDSCLNQLKRDEFGTGSVNHGELFKNLGKHLEKLRCEPTQSVTSDNLLQELMEIGIMETSPLKDFPPNVNENIYVSIVQLCLESARDTIKLLIDLMVPKELPIDHTHIMKLAYVVSLFVKVNNEKNSAMAKLKSVVLKVDGLTNEGMNKLSNLGVCESDRLLRYTKRTKKIFLSTGVPLED